MKKSWFNFLRRNKSCQNTSNGNNGDDRKSRRQRALRALIRWIINGTALAVVHNQLYQTSWTIAVCIGIAVGFFSALLQYQTSRLTKFYESDILANRHSECEPQTSRRKIESLRWIERASRWFTVEVIYVLFSETVRALFGINLIGSISLIAYIGQRLLGAITSTVSQGAFELACLAWRKKRIESGVCTKEKADSQRDLAFLIGSFLSVSSLAASLSPYPKLGYCGFGVLVVGAIIFLLQTLKTTTKRQQ